MGIAEIDVQRSAERFLTASDGVQTWHCFSFGEHYDPANTSFGRLIALNDTVVQAGRGFFPHRHADVEIVTWVLAGVLQHEDSTGQRGDISPGVVQRLSAGTGVVHTETAPQGVPETSVGSTATRFVQMWLRSDDSEGPPHYAQKAAEPDGLANGLVVVASGRPRDREEAIPLACGGAALLVGRLAPDRFARVPDADFVLAYVARGAVELDSGLQLEEGDSARLTGVSGMSIRSLQAAEVLVWDMDSS